MFLVRCKAQKRTWVSAKGRGGDDASAATRGDAGAGPHGVR